MKDIDIPPINTLMLIDDSDVDQMIYRRIAQKSGLVRDLVQFLDARQALAHLNDPTTESPDLILLDINMPGMDGFEFLEAATDELGADLCPVVVMLTTSLNPKDEVRAKSFEVVREFLNKPLTVDQLKALSQMLARDTSAETG